MRQIKFRGKKIGSSEWVYGDLLINNGQLIIVQQVNRNYIGMVHVRDGCHWHIETPAFRVDLETVCQYTGLKDKNGKDIYCGDIVTNESYIFEVEWNQQQAKFALNPIKCIKDKEEWVLTTLEYQNLGNGYFSRKDLEVIGSVHDNPELLDK